MTDQLYRHAKSGDTSAVKAWVVPVENDPARLPELDGDDECPDLNKGNFCVRPVGHDGMHLKMTYWLEGGDDE